MFESEVGDVVFWKKYIIYLVYATGMYIFFKFVCVLFTSAYIRF